MSLVQFSPPPGLDSDSTSYDTKGRWATGKNVRFWNKKPETIGGWTKMFASALSGTPRGMFAFMRSGTATMAYGTSSKLYVGSGAAQPTDRSPVGLPGSITGWTFGAWGTTLLSSPRGGTLYEQVGTSTATEVTVAPDRIDGGILLTDQRQVLALGANEVGGTHNPMCIRVSDIEDYSSGSAWTPSASNNADEIILQGQGTIIAGRLIGSYVAVWTERELYLGHYVGDPAQSYRFDKVDEQCGLIGADAVTVIAGRAYWVAPDLTVRTWAPGELPSAVPCPVSRIVFISGLDYTNRTKIIVSSVSKYQEVWIFYPSIGGSGEPTLCAAFSLKDGSWFTGDVPRTAWLDNAIMLSPLSSYKSHTIGAASDGYVYVQETGSTADGSAQNWFLQSADFYFENGGRRMMIRTAYPDFEAQTGTVAMVVYGRSYPNSDATELGKAVSLTQGLEKSDFRFSAKLFTFKLAESGTSSMRLGRLAFEVVPMGER